MLGVPDHNGHHHANGSKTSTLGASFSRLVKRIAKTKERSAGEHDGGEGRGADIGRNGKEKDSKDERQSHSQQASNDSGQQHASSAIATHERPPPQPLASRTSPNGADDGIIIANTSTLLTTAAHVTTSNTNGDDNNASETFTWSRRVDYLLKAYAVPDLTTSINPDSQRHISTLTKIGHADGHGVVALKSLPQKWDENAEHVLRAIGTWFNDLSHPNVLRLYGLAKPRLNTRLVAPWMVNGNVFDYLVKHRDVPPLRVAKGIAEGLKYLHERKARPVTHGNLKTSNILVTDKGEPVISDLDLHLIHRDSGEAGAGMKTRSTRSDAMSVRNPWGLAPELLFEDAPPDARSDVYAFGMVILEITALTAPFSEINPLNSARLIVHVYGGGRPARPTSPESIARGLSDELWSLLERCWARSASERPSASELSSILHALSTSREEDSVQKMHDALLERVPDVTRQIVLVDGLPVVGGGSFGDIRVAKLEGVGKVVLKSLRPGSWAPPTRLTKVSACTCLRGWLVSENQLTFPCSWICVFRVFRGSFAKLPSGVHSTTPTSFLSLASQNRQASVSASSLRGWRTGTRMNT